MRSVPSAHTVFRSSHAGVRRTQALRWPSPAPPCVQVHLLRQPPAHTLADQLRWLVRDLQMRCAAVNSGGGGSSSVHGGAMRRGSEGATERVGSTLRPTLRFQVDLRSTGEGNQQRGNDQSTVGASDVQPQSHKARKNRRHAESSRGIVSSDTSPRWFSSRWLTHRGAKLGVQRRLELRHAALDRLHLALQRPHRGIRLVERCRAEQGRGCARGRLATRVLQAVAAETHVPSSSGGRRMRQASPRAHSRTRLQPLLGLLARQVDEALAHHVGHALVVQQHHLAARLIQVRHVRLRGVGEEQGRGRERAWFGSQAPLQASSMRGNTRGRSLHVPCAPPAAPRARPAAC